MCFADPITLAAAAATGFGNFLNAQEANQNNRRMTEARNAATRDEIARQGAFQQQAGDAFSGALGRFAPNAYQAGLEGAQGDARGFIRGNQPTDVGSILLAGAPSQSVAAEGKTVADAFARNASRADALGNLTGYRQQGVGDSLALSGSGRRLDTIRDASRGSASLVPLEREVAGGNAFRPSSGLGDILTGIGNIVAFGSGSGTLPVRNLFRRPTGPPLDIRPMGVR